MNISTIESQIKEAIALLVPVYENSGEPTLGNYLRLYKDALQKIEDEKFDYYSLNKLCNCARGYLEVSSNWDQPFLHAMGRTEELIKELLG